MKFAEAVKNLGDSGSGKVSFHDALRRVNPEYAKAVSLKRANAEADRYRKESDYANSFVGMTANFGSELGRNTIDAGLELVRAPVTIPLKVTQSLVEGATGIPQSYAPSTPVGRFVYGDKTRSTYQADQNAATAFLESKGVGKKTSIAGGALAGSASVLLELLPPSAGNAFKTLFSRVKGRIVKEIPEAEVKTVSETVANITGAANDANMEKAVSEALGKGATRDEVIATVSLEKQKSDFSSAYPYLSEDGQAMKTFKEAVEETRVSPSIEPSVVQIIDTATGEKTFKTIPSGELPVFQGAIDDTANGIAGKEIDGKIYHLTAKTPESMVSRGFTDAGTAKIADIPSNPTKPQEFVSKMTETPATPVKEDIPVTEPTYVSTEGTSGLAQSVRSKAIRDKVIYAFDRNFADLPKYDKRIKREDFVKATDLVLNDYKNAVDIAMGKVRPPKDILPEDVFVALNEHATLTNDYEMLRMLANESGLTGEATLMGQRIQALSRLNPDSAISQMKSLVRERTASVEKKTGKSVSKLREKTVKDIKEKIRQDVPKKETWISFIESIKC